MIETTENMKTEHAIMRLGKWIGEGRLDDIEYRHWLQCDWRPLTNYMVRDIAISDCIFRLKPRKPKFYAVAYRLTAAKVYENIGPVLQNTPEVRAALKAAELI